jgi:hypothetical protein
MNRNRLLSVIVAGVVLSLLPASPSVDVGAETRSREVWTAWEEGDVARARQTAAFLLDGDGPVDDARHILCLTSFVMGDYEDALSHHAKIDPRYNRYGELDRPVLDAYLHLARYADAERFARARGMPDWQCDMLAKRKERPLHVRLDGLSVVPFADHPLCEYFPAFDVEIDGKKVVAHMDTGGTYLLMGPSRAKALGIEVTEGGKGYHGSRQVKTHHGMVGEFRIGEAVLENVPVVVLASLEGQQDFIVFGTNVLQQFFSTLDYLDNRMILSPRDNAEERKKHLAMLPADRVEVPFYMWGDHYMFARGSMGEHERLNFFIDSGLVSLHPDGNGGLRQAAFTAPRGSFLEWGFEEEKVGERVFESDKALGLGPLEQTGLLFLTGDNVSWDSFGGVRIDGLLSHAFLQQYAWTLDFSNRKYIFTYGPSP